MKRKSPSRVRPFHHAPLPFSLPSLFNVLLNCAALLWGLRSDPSLFSLYLSLCSLRLAMATEEANKPSTLPPYPEMILAALDALHEKEGANKTAISKYIESKYGELPAEHPSLLAHHLSRMKEIGQLVFAKNNYMRFDPNAPPRRGRGRPPKPKIPVPAGTVLAPARPRGRPRKDPNAPPTPKIKKPAAKIGSKSGRGRGRPPKVKPQQAQAGIQAS
ncbi:hypothetical protein NMG60_11026556 [Bertholletia excelsa]